MTCESVLVDFFMYSFFILDDCKFCICLFLNFDVNDNVLFQNITLRTKLLLSNTGQFYHNKLIVFICVVLAYNQEKKID